METQMKTIMSLAWAIAKETNTTIGNGLKVAWRNAKLRQVLKRGVTHFQYRKVSGELRDAFGTLSEMVIPSHNNAMGTVRKPSEQIQCYYDIERNAWRSFRKANLIQFA